MTFSSGGFAWQGILLILAGAFLRALYVINNKRNLKRVSSRFMIVLNMLGSGLLLFTLMLLFARPHVTDWFSWPGGIFWPLVATILFNIFIQYSELKSLQYEDASLVTPMSAAAPVLSLLFGFLILRELPTIAGWFGVFLISVGSYILNVSKPTMLSNGTIPPSSLRRHLHTLSNFLLPWTALSKSLGVRLALLGAIAGSISINFDKLVAVKTNPFFLPSIVFTSVGLVMLCFLKKLHIPQNLSWREKGALLLSPLLFAGTVLLFVAGLSFGLASYSSALRRTAILFVVLLAGPLLKERGHPERIWGGIIMTLGVVLLAF